MYFFFFKQKTAYEMRISDWSSDVCSSDLGLTKEYGVCIICTQTTRDTLPSDWAFRELDLVCVKGKIEPVAIYEPIGPKDGLDPDLRQDLARHRGALQHYRAQRWDAAELEFFNLSQSGRRSEEHTSELQSLMRI